MFLLECCVGKKILPTERRKNECSEEMGSWCVLLPDKFDNDGEDGDDHNEDDGDDDEDYDGDDDGDDDKTDNSNNDNQGGRNDDANDGCVCFCRPFRVPLPTSNGQHRVHCFTSPPFKRTFTAYVNAKGRICYVVTST